MSEELNPCPFCGGEASIGFSEPIHEEGIGEATALCGSCGFEWSTEAVGFGVAKQQAIAAWNRRTPDPRVSALVEAGKEARGILADLAHPDDSQRSVSSQVYWARCVEAEVKIRTALAAFEAGALKEREG